MPFAHKASISFTLPRLESWFHKVAKKPGIDNSLKIGRLC